MTTQATKAIKFYQS